MDVEEAQPANVLVGISYLKMSTKRSSKRIKQKLQTQKREVRNKELNNRQQGLTPVGKLIDGNWVVKSIITSDKIGAYDRLPRTFLDNISYDHPVFQPESGVIICTSVTLYGPLGH